MGTLIKVEPTSLVLRGFTTVESGVSILDVQFAMNWELGGRMHEC